MAAAALVLAIVALLAVVPLYVVRCSGRKPATPESTWRPTPTERRTAEVALRSGSTGFVLTGSQM